MNRDMSISEIMKRLRRASCESEFTSVQIMLMDREKNAKTEIENLTRDRDSFKKEVTLLERNLRVAESAKSRTEERLQKAQSKFEEMKETIARLKDKNSAMGKEIEDLRREKSASAEMVEELRRKKSETDKVVEELKRENDELRLKNVDCEKELVPRITKLEHEIAELFKYRESSRKLGGGRNMIWLLTKEGRSNVARDSPAPDPPQAENNVTDHDQDHNGAKGSDPHANKMAPSSSPVVNIIEILDDDDEMNHTAATPITDRVVASNAGEKETILDKSDQNPPSRPTKKRSRTDSEADHLVNTSTKGERSISERNPNNLPRRVLIDEDSMDSDDDSTDSCSSSHIKNLIAELRSKTARQRSMNEMK